MKPEQETIQEFIIILMIAVAIVVAIVVVAVVVAAVVAVLWGGGRRHICAFGGRFRRPCGWADGRKDHFCR